MTDEDIEKKPNGRPTKYSEEIRDEICSRLAMGESLRTICRDKHLPERMTVHRWIIENKGERVIEGVIESEGFCYHYARAKDICMDEMADEAIEVSKTPVKAQRVTFKQDKDGNPVEEVVVLDAVDRSRLHVETIKWYTGKLAPKKYGNERTIRHQQLDAEGNETAPPTTEVNIYAKDIADSVHAELGKMIEEQNDEENA